jgi:hypothetical protein
MCVDVDLDGDTECQWTAGSSCMTNAECVAAVCGDQDGNSTTECGTVGPCLDGDDCPMGWECVDVNSDGQLECQSAGPCRLDEDCLERELCFDDTGGGVPACQS